MLRAKVAGSGALLLITSAYHGSGHRQVVEAVASLPRDLAAMTGGLWLFFSWHLAVLGLAAILAAVVGRAWARPVLLFCGLVAAGDFLWVFGLAGWFPGTVLLLLAALGLLVGGVLWRLPKVAPGASDQPSASMR